MTPDYKKAAARAAETSASFGSCSSPDDVLRILKSFPSVFVASLDVNPLSEKEAWDAFTLVREKNGASSILSLITAAFPLSFSFASSRGNWATSSWLTTAQLRRRFGWRKRTAFLFI